MPEEIAKLQKGSDLFSGLKTLPNAVNVEALTDRLVWSAA